MRNLSFFHSVLYPFGELPAIFVKFEYCLLTHSVWKSLKFFVWERVDIAVENIVRKRQIACNKQFLLSSQCFSILHGTYFPL